MIRHISVFTLEDKKELPLLKSLLEEAGKKCSLIRQSKIGENITALQKEGLEGPDFGDLVQIIDFDTPEDAKAYPASEAHINLGLQFVKQPYPPHCLIKFLYVGSRTLLCASFIHVITDTNLRSATLGGKYPWSDFH